MPSSAWRGSTASFRGTTTTRTSCSCAGAARSEWRWSGVGRSPSWSAGDLFVVPAGIEHRPVRGGWSCVRDAPRATGDEAIWQRLGAAPWRRRVGRPPDASASPRIPVRKTYKLYVGGQFPRSESGRSYVVRSPGRHAARQRRSLVAQGRSRRCAHGARRCSRLGRQDGDEPRSGPVSRRRADGGAARAVRRRGRRPLKG